MNATEGSLSGQRRSNTFVLLLMAAISFSLLFGSQGYANDRHAGYYYPKPQSEESYQAPTRVLTGVSRLSRVGFVTQLDQLQKKRPYAPAYHMFAKGSVCESLTQN